VARARCPLGANLKLSESTPKRDALPILDRERVPYPRSAFHVMERPCKRQLVAVRIGHVNVHRHSGSAVAKICIARSNGHVRVEVADQGKGIPPEKKAAMNSAGMPGVGIRGIRERLRQLGGTLQITSNGVGTLVLAELPVASTPSTAAA
jgi:signal transduction histidine kinase